VGALRRVEYTYVFAVEAVDGSTSSREEGDIADLIHAADPYLFLGGAAPSLTILNDFFAGGGAERGPNGGAEWTPFTITAEEYDALMAYLGTPAGQAKFRLDSPVQVADTPPHVFSVADFHDWKIEEALKDPHHYLNRPERRMRVNGQLVSFREYWEHKRSNRRQ
jgi:hypothetical protein